MRLALGLGLGVGLAGGGAWALAEHGAALGPFARAHAEAAKRPPQLLETQPFADSSDTPVTIDADADDLPASTLGKLRRALGATSLRATLGRLFVLAVHFLPVIVLFPIWWIAHGRWLVGDQRGAAVDVRDWRLWWLHLAVSSLQRCGPLYIKFGQWISSRTDVLPPAVCAVFAQLQAHVRPHDFTHTREVIERDLLQGRQLETAFEWFDETPIGCGAIAQVHQAKLRSLPELGAHGGAECAVKVMHPNVEPQIEADLALISLAAALIAMLPGTEYLSISDEVALFGRMIHKQTDMRIEATNLDRFAFNFSKSNPGVTIPQPVRPFVGKRVLIETFQSGVPLRNVIERGPTVFDREIATIGLRAFMKMVLQDNFCHADLHPGNVLVTFERKIPNASLFSTARGSFAKTQTLGAQELARLSAIKSDSEWRDALEALKRDGFAPRLVLLDVGLVCELSAANLDNVRESFKAGLEFDSKRLAQLLTARCRYPDKVVDIPGVEAAMQQMMQDVKINAQGQLLLSQLHAVHIVSRFTELIRKHHIALEGDFVGLFVAGIIVEGVGRTLHGDLDILETLAEYLE
nr:hypothetical protein HK105_005691 [Polyrhizophydium stewartii]